MAQNLAWAGIPAIVAMQHLVSDRAAITFARHFYEELAASGTLEDALTEARLSLSSPSEGTEWAIPVLYMRFQSGVLVGSVSGWKRSTAGLSLQVRKLAAATRERGSRLRKVPLWGWLAAALLLGGGYGVERWWKDGMPSGASQALEAAMPKNPSNPCSSLNVLDIKFASVGPGSYSTTKGRVRRTIPVPRQLCMGAYEVTQAEWRQVTGESPSNFEGDSLPVERVNWPDVRNFLDKLNSRLAHEKCRLPTSDEWGFAARAGGETKYSFGNDASRVQQFANCGHSHDEGGTKTVGTFPGNRWGLYDMEGNVSEWVDSDLPLSPGRRLIRGGSWHLIPSSCTVDQEKEIGEETRRFDIGLRLVCEQK